MQVYSTVWPVKMVKRSIWQFMLLKKYSPFHSWVFYYLLTRYFDSPFLRQSFNHSNHTVKKNILRKIDFFGASVVLLMSSKRSPGLLNCLYGIVMCLFFNFFFTTIITYSTSEKRRKKTLIQYKNKIQNNLIQKSNTN